MQNKGKLGSVVAGIIAIFLVIICLFYLSFSIATNHFEGKAKEYAVAAAGQEGEASDTYRLAYKSYIDSISKEKVYLGYTFNEVQKLGVGLGLDLKGGMNVTLQVSVPDIIRSIAKNETSAFNQAIAAADSIVNKTKDSDYVGVFCREYKRIDPQGNLAVVFKGLDIPRGASEDQVEQKLKQEVKDRVSSSTNVLRTRIDQFGVVAPNIQELEKDGQILLELPGVKEHDRVRELLKSSANLEFYETYQVSEIQPQLMQLHSQLAADTTLDGRGFWGYFLQPGGNSPIAVGIAAPAQRAAIDAILASPAARRILPSNLKLAWEFKPQIVEVADSVTGRNRKIEYYTLVALKTIGGKAALSGDVITSATSDFENLQGNYVSMNMTPEAAKQWARITAANLNKQVAIVLDDQVYSAPNVNSVIEGGRSQITGDFTTDEAKDLANVLKSGKMAAKVDIISDTVIGPTLGQQAIEDGFMSFGVALVLLMIFMMAFYGVIPGLIANLGLVFNLFFTFGILASFQAVLTLSGIAGIVLALGMAVDANVLIFERTKEELRAGKKTPSGYCRWLQQRILGNLRLQPHIDYHRRDPALLRYRSHQGLCHHADHRYHLLVLHSSVPHPSGVYLRSQDQGDPESDLHHRPLG